MLLVIHGNWSYGSYVNFLPSFCPSVFVCLFAHYFYIILLTFFQTIFLNCFIFELGRITWISNNTTVFLGEGKNSSLPLFKFGILRYIPVLQDSMHPRRPRGNTSGRQLGRHKRRGESFQARSGARAPGDTARPWKLSSRRFARLDWLPRGLRGWIQCESTRCSYVTWYTVLRQLGFTSFSVALGTSYHP